MKNIEKNSLEVKCFLSKIKNTRILELEKKLFESKIHIGK